MKDMVVHRNGTDKKQVETKYDLYNTITEVLTHGGVPNIYKQREFTFKMETQLKNFALVA